MPARPERELFTDLIRILATELKAPRFEPHLTIFSALPSRKSPKNLLAKLKAAPVHLHVKGIGVSPHYPKTLFVRLDSNKTFQRFVAELRRATKTRGKTPTDPHISLVYKKRLPAKALRELAKAVKLPFSHVVFKSVAAVRSVSPIETRADVEGWRVIATKSLSE